MRAFALLWLAAIVGCRQVPPTDSPPPAERLRVYTTFFPTSDFARRLGGELVEVTLPLPTDADPIFWIPDSAALAGYQRADLVVLNGAGFEKWVDKVSLPLSRVVSTARGFEEEWLRYEDAVEHVHGPTGRHSHAGLDGHTWLDPTLAKRQARAIADALVARRPDGRAGIEARYAKLAAELDGLDARWRRIATAIGDRPLLASHPAYHYAARRYGLDVHSLDLDPQTPLTDAQWVELETGRATRPATLMLWEAVPLATTRAALKSRLGVESVVFTPAEQPPVPPAGFVAVMTANLDRLEAAAAR